MIVVSLSFFKAIVSSLKFFFVLFLFNVSGWKVTNTLFFKNLIFKIFSNSFLFKILCFFIESTPKPPIQKTFLGFSPSWIILFL